MKNKEGIKGMWLPGQVCFNNRELSHTDKFVWWLISSLNTENKYCFASNEYIAKMLDLKSPQTVSNSIAKLRRLEYIQEVSFDGRRRVLKINEKFMEKYEYLVHDYNKKVHTQGIKKVIVDKSSLSVLPFSKEKAFPFGTQTAGNPTNAIVQRNSPLAQSTSERMRASTDPLAPPIKPTKPVDCSPIIKELLDYWNSKPLRHLSQNKENPTKTYRNTVCNLKKLLLGSFFKDLPLTPTYHSFVKSKYDIASFKEAVDKFVLMATDPQYLPKNKKTLKSMSISDFLYSDRMTFTPSHFLHCLNCELKKVTTSFHKSPELTDMLVLRYKETTSMSFQPSSAQMDKFIMASNRLSNFFEKNKHRLNGGITHKVWNEKNKVDLLLNAVYADTNGEPFGLGWLCSNDTFDRRLPVYFEDHRF